MVDAIVDHQQRLREQPPVRTGTPAELRDRLNATAQAPAGPGDPHAALRTLLDDVVPFMQRGDHPRFFARVGSPSNAVSALADALAAGLNVISASWAGGSGPAALELIVLDWLRQWMGMPDGTEGILVSGGSVGSLTALAAAREAVHPEVAYVSDQTHASLTRALRLLGVPVETIPSDAAFRLPAAHLRLDRPAIVVGTAGTTNTGAVDPLDQLADRCGQRDDVWLHVDGAYGGPAAMTDRGGQLLRGMERADSLVVDPHKWLFQPYEIGSVLVRRPGALQKAFVMFPEYLRDVGVGEEEVAFRDRGPQLSRGSRALKLWLSVQTFGVDAFRAGVQHGIDLAERAQQAIERTPGLEVVTPAQLGIVTFRHTTADNAQLVDRVVADGYAAPSSTVLRGQTVLRLCTINPRTTFEEIDRTVERIAELAAGPLSSS